MGQKDHLLIDQPNHERWYLPDTDYMYDIETIEHVVHVCVIHAPTGRKLHQHTLSIFHPDHGKLLSLGISLAVKKYYAKPKKVENKHVSGS